MPEGDGGKISAIKRNGRDEPGHQARSANRDYACEMNLMFM
jgi:hypothetical protein